MTSLPEDPEDWTDEEWLAWLAEGDVAADAGDGVDDTFAPGASTGRRRSLGAEMVAAAMSGLAEAMYGPREKPAIVVDASGDPPGDGALDVQLDPEHPEHSVVVVRPWLLRASDEVGPEGPKAGP